MADQTEVERQFEAWFANHGYKFGLPKAEEAAPATPISHDVLAGAAVAGRHEKAATADPGQRSIVGPDDIQGEAGSPAPAGCPQCGSVNRDYCNPECSNISTRNEWHRLAAPAPTEEK